MNSLQSLFQNFESSINSMVFNICHNENSIHCWLKRKKIFGTKFKLLQNSANTSTVGG